MKLKINNKIIISLSFIVVTINGLIGHFFAPIEITFTPVVIIATTSLILFATMKMSIVWRSMLTYLFIAVNDIFIKLYGGGSHDNEGLEWIHLYMFAGLIPAGIMLLIKILVSNEESITAKLAAIILFPALMYVHFQLFDKLGLGRYYNLH